MSTEQQQIEWIEAYLLDQLSKAEKDKFESILQKDEALQVKLALQEEIMLGIERIGLKEEIAKAQKNYFKRNNGIYWGGAGLVIAIALLSFYFINRPNKEADIKEIEKSEQAPIHQKETKKIKKQTTVLDTHRTSELEREVTSEKIEHDTIKWPTKAEQYFTIHPHRDTLINGREGTIIEFKANSFAVNSAKPITIQLKEYYQLSEMLFDQLTTQTTNSEILESGGMIQLEALSEDGREVALKEESTFTVKFPKKGSYSNASDQEMTTYYGDRAADDNVYWEKAKSPIVKEWKPEEIESTPLESRVGLYSTTSKDQIEFIHQDESVDDYIKNTICFTEKAVQEGIKGVVTIFYSINLEGRVEEVKVTRAKGVPPQYYQNVINLVKTFPIQKLQKLRGSYVTSFRLEISVNSLSAKSVPNQTALQAYYDSIQAVRRTEKSFTVEMGEKMDQNRRTEIEEKLANGTQNQDVLEDDINFYVLSSSRLGWINCDRSIDSEGPKIDVVVDKAYRDAQIRLIFHEELAILNAREHKSGASFINLPKGKRVSIFAIRKASEGWEICFREMVISKQISQLEFNPLTPELLQSTATEINQLHTP